MIDVKKLTLFRNIHVGQMTHEDTQYTVCNITCTVFGGKDTLLCYSVLAAP